MRSFAKPLSGWARIRNLEFETRKSQRTALFPAEEEEFYKVAPTKLCITTPRFYIGAVMRFWPKFLLSSQLKNYRFLVQVPKYFSQKFFAGRKRLSIGSGGPFSPKIRLRLSKHMKIDLHVLRILREAAPRFAFFE